jgi:AAA15 family ATPase/GTPase
VIRQSAKIIAAAVQRNVQVILTTHSLELIDALLGEAKDRDLLDKLAVFRTNLTEGQLATSRISGADAAFSRQQIEDDLR